MKKFEMSKSFKNNLQKAHDKFIKKGFESIDEAYKVMNTYKTFKDLEEYVQDFIIDYILETEGNENISYIYDDDKIVKIEEGIKVIKAKDIKAEDTILEFDYTLTVAEYENGHKFIGNIHNKTFHTELKVINIKIKDEKIKVFGEGKGNYICRTYNINELIEIL